MANVGLRYLNMTETACPKCESPDIYHDGSLWICPICAHEWTEQAGDSKAVSRDAPEDEDLAVRDANGNVLADGDSVVVIKDLPVKGAKAPIKSGTKVKSIKLVPPVAGHNISCKIDGFGALHLKSEFVRKA